MVTPEEIEQAVKTLSKVEPGFVPIELFTQLARLNTQAIIELVVLRKNESGQVETLLLQRPDEDPYWPGQWCNPGCVIRPSDEPPTFKDAFARLQEELELSEMPEPRFAGINFFETMRGKHFTGVYWIELNKAETGQFFAVADLPADTMPSQIPVIHQAAEHFSKSTTEE